MTNDLDPRAAIKADPMTSFQIAVVALCVLVAALDGFDVLVIAYTAPSIAGEWRLGPADLGIVLSAGLVGMGIGGLLLGIAGDRLGRRPVVLLCLAIVTLGMAATSLATNILELAGMRAFTGLGIGGALVSINVIVSEYSSLKRKNLAIALMTIGYPVGATLGGFVSIFLIANFGWRSVYLFGGAVGLALIPAAFVWLPESLEFLLTRRRGATLPPVNGIMARMGKAPLAILPPVPDRQPQARDLATILASGEAIGMLASSGAYFLTSFTCYFLLSWMPRLLTERGLSLTAGISSSLLMNIAGAIGCLAFGLFAPRIGARKLAALLMLCLFVLTGIFGLVDDSASSLISVTAAIGFCLFASITALYAIVPNAFAAPIRSTGTGVSMSVGRIGSMAGPLLAGILIARGFSREAYCIILAAPMLLAALSLYWVRAHVPTELQGSASSSVRESMNVAVGQA